MLGPAVSGFFLTFPLYKSKFSNGIQNGLKATTTETQNRFKMKDIRKRDSKRAKGTQTRAFLSHSLSAITQIKKSHKMRAFATVQPWDFLLSVAANMFKL